MPGDCLCMSRSLLLEEPSFFFLLLDCSFRPLEHGGSFTEPVGALTLFVFIATNSLKNTLKKHSYNSVTTKIH